VKQHDIDEVPAEIILLSIIKTLEIKFIRLRFLTVSPSLLCWLCSTRTRRSRTSAFPV